MKKFFGLLCALSLFLSVPGCSEGSTETKSVTDGARQSDVDAYNAAIAAESASMSADPPKDLAAPAKTGAAPAKEAPAKEAPAAAPEKAAPGE